MINVPSFSLSRSFTGALERARREASTRGVNRILYVSFAFISTSVKKSYLSNMIISISGRNRFYVSYMYISYNFLYISIYRCMISLYTFNNRDIDKHVRARSDANSVKSGGGMAPLDQGVAAGASSSLAARETVGRERTREAIKVRARRHRELSRSGGVTECESAIDTRLVDHYTPR